MICQWSSSAWKDTWYHCKLILHWDITSHPLGWLLQKKPKGFGEDVEKLEPLDAVVETVEWHNHYGKQCSRSSKQLRLELQCDPIVSLVGIHSKELKAASQKDMCSLKFIAALFAMSNRWNPLFPFIMQLDRWKDKHNVTCTKSIVWPLKERKYFNKKGRVFWHMLWHGVE